MNMNVCRVSLGWHYTVAALAIVFASSACPALLAQPYIFTVTKTAVYLQTNTSLPVLDSDGTYMFVAQVRSDDYLFLFANATLTPPGKPAINMPVSPGLDGFRVDAALGTKSELDAAYPPGTYVCTITDLLVGQTALQIELDGDHYPPPPWVVNYSDAQGVCPTEDFSVMFPPLTETNFLNMVTLQVVEPTGGIQQETFRTTITATPSTASIGLPADTVQLDKVYYGVLVFFRTSAYAETDNGQAGANFSTLTQFYLCTPAEPLLRVSRSAPSAPVTIRFNAIAGYTYRLLGSEDLRTWTELQTLPATQGYEEFQVTPPGKLQFFRVAR